MDCSRYRREISLLLDGELDRSSVQGLESHLAVCADCRRIHERMTVLDEGLRSLGPEIPRPGLTAKVKDRVADERKRSFPETGIPVYARVSLFAMLVLIAVGLGSLAGRSVGDLLRHESPVQTVEMLVVDRSPSFAGALYDMKTGEQVQ